MLGEEAWVVREGGTGVIERDPLDENGRNVGRIATGTGIADRREALVITEFNTIEKERNVVGITAWRALREISSDISDFLETRARQPNVDGSSPGGG
jgi:hypothetical protein